MRAITNFPLPTTSIYPGEVLIVRANSRNVSIMATKWIRWIALLVATVVFPSVALAQKPVGPPTPSLVVAPATGITVSGVQGGPLSPSVFQYFLSASIGTVSYSIRTPSWLTATPSFGTAGTGGVMVTLTVNPTAFRLEPGVYGPGIAFTNVTNGQGSATRAATLTVQKSSPVGSPSATPAPKGQGGFLLDGHGGHLLDDRGKRLIGQ
jgi:hypothetical protein